MNQSSTPVIDGQAPARRFGYLIAFFAILCTCSVIIGVTFAFNKKEVEILKNSFHLQSNGVKTTGTIAEVEQHQGSKPFSSSTFYFFVEYVVDGQTYRIKSNTFYPTRSSSWVGETMPIIYDTDDPTIAQIDSFEERWLNPIIALLPF